MRRFRISSIHCFIERTDAFVPLAIPRRTTQSRPSPQEKEIAIGKITLSYRISNKFAFRRLFPIIVTLSNKLSEYIRKIFQPIKISPKFSPSVAIFIYEIIEKNMCFQSFSRREFKIYIYSKFKIRIIIPRAR